MTNNGVRGGWLNGRNALMRFRRLSWVFVLVSFVSGCGLFQGDLWQDSFWASSPLRQNNEAELGIAALATGNYVTAEGHFKRALRANPKDVDALLGAGTLYQYTGQTTRARQMYEAVLALRPGETQRFVVWNSIDTKPASEIASVNLALLDSGNVTKSVQAGTGAPAPSTFAPVSEAITPPVASAPTSSPLLGRTTPAPNTSAPAMTEMPVGGFAGGDQNIVSRFATLRALRDQGLMTNDEYQTRRRANIGALLPLTSPPPSAGLDRPVPSTEQISGRLRAIGRALEMRAISVAQHSSERKLILDALMPSAPVVVANPKPAPRGLLEAADQVRRLEQLRDDGFISEDEYQRERQAIELAIKPKAPASDIMKAPAATPKAKKAPVKMEKMSAGPQPGIHLASYRSRKQAERGWKNILKANLKLLKGFEPFISKVNLGRKKGIYYRLKVGPLKSASQAREFCKKLKRRRQYCEPTVIENG